ncbi:MAG: hypothetical protein HOO87_16220 [Methyloglobulus sp.]|nr:hypothetical protein [Methyloglobulus sp.]
MAINPATRHPDDFAIPQPGLPGLLFFVNVHGFYTPARRHSASTRQEGGKASASAAATLQHLPKAWNGG